MGKIKELFKFKKKYIKNENNKSNLGLFFNNNELLVLLENESEEKFKEDINNLKDQFISLSEIINYFLNKNILSEEKLFQKISNYFQIKYLKIVEFSFSDNTLKVMSKFDKEYINTKKFIILKTDDLKYKVAVCDPENIEIIEQIKSKNKNIIIEKTLISYSTFYHLYNIYLDKLSLLTEIDDNTIETNEEIDLEDLTNEDNPIVKLTNNIFVDAVRKGSSDIHIEPYRNQVKIKNRIDGVLIKEKTDIPKSYHDMIISRIKILSNLNIAEHRIPQDGRFKRVIGNKEIDFRVSIMPTSFGESAVLRILDKKDGVLSLEMLGVSAEEKQKILSEGLSPYGMILVTGPTGSGKTTTLYALLNEIQENKEKIITIEDPVEYQLDDVTQIPVNEKTGLTFAKGLRSILRQDPDKIMVGEIRDKETAEIAIQAALTGHLVLTTLHSNSTVESIGRLINMGVDTYQFATALNVIIGQRLMRKICTKCQGKGCITCNYTGYKGRTGVFEIFKLDEEIKEMVIKRESPLKIKDKAVSKGMRDVKTSALIKINENFTTKEEFERVIGRWEEDDIFHK